MKRNPKRTLLAWLLTAAMLVSLLPTAAFASEAEEETAVETLSEEGYRLNEDAATSGTCGDNLTWTLEDGVLTISGTGEMYFNGISPWGGSSVITSVVVNDGVTSIGYSAFYGCTGLTSITIPDSVTSIGSSAFDGCTSLTSVTIPDSVTSIGYYAFYGCTGLTSITIGSGVTSIGGYAFYDCTGLTSVTIGSDVTSIGNSAFHNTAFYNDESNWENGVLYLGNYLLKADADSLEGSYAIKEGTTVIAEFAFSYCTSLTSVTISDNVTCIDYGAFDNCTSLTSVTIPDSVTRIDGYVFYDCTSLTDVYYSGRQASWAAISVDEVDGGNECLESATIWYLDFTWSDNCTTCSVSVTNSGNSDAQTLDCTVTTSVVDATCTEDGKIVYTAACSLNDVIVSSSVDSTVDTVPATGHTAGEAAKENVVEATATADGSYDSVVYCTVCGEELSRESVTVPATGGSSTSFLFSDVTTVGSWYYNAVYWAYDLGITEGYSDGTFRPNNNCTRAEFTTFLYALANAYGLENAGDTESTSFTDVAEGNWYYTYVMWAAENGLVSGYSDGTFKPNNQITRAEAVTMLYGFYKSFVNGGQEPTVSAGESGFSDLSDSAWYYKYMMWATQNGVVSGYDDGTCRPNTNCTRSVMVVLLYATANHLL